MIHNTYSKFYTRQETKLYRPLKQTFTKETKNSLKFESNVRQKTNPYHFNKLSKSNHLSEKNDKTQVHIEKSLYFI